MLKQQKEMGGMAIGVVMAGRDNFGGVKTEPPKDTPTLADVSIDKELSSRAHLMTP